MKKILKAAGISLLCFFLYIVLGALLPFGAVKNETGNLTDEISRFYGESEEKERAALIEENEDALLTRLSMIEEAEEEIILSTFDIRTGNSTTDVFSALIAAADRGVAVKIYVDGLYGMIHMRGRELFEAAGSHENVEIRFYNEPNLLRPWTVNGRMHDKYLIVDDHFLLMGGRNMFDYFLGEGDSNVRGNDMEVLIWQEDNGKGTGAIAQVKAYFSQIWNQKYSKAVFEDKSGKGTQQELARLRNHYITMKKQEKFPVSENWKTRTVEIENALLVTNPNHIMKKSPDVWYTLYELMRQAKESVIIQTPYAVFSKEMYEGIAQIAKNVPETKLLINSRAAGDNLVASADYTKNWTHIVQTGMPVYEYQGEHSCHGNALSLTMSCR